jgi:hypothetical protein
MATSANSSPQWSPPVVGGVTGQHRVQGSIPALAAMEPAGHRRGGRVRAADLQAAARAAMEPAGHRRGHAARLASRLGASVAAMEPASRDLADRQLLGVQAAMEPAGHRRDDYTVPSPYWMLPSSRQWSPPVIGG